MYMYECSLLTYEFSMYYYVCSIYMLMFKNAQYIPLYAQWSQNIIVVVAKSATIDLVTYVPTINLELKACKSHCQDSILTFPSKYL